MIEVYSGGSCRVDWTVYRSGCDNVTVDFRRSDLKVLLSSDKGRMLVPFSELDGVLSVDIPSDLPVGVYGLQALWVKNGNHDCRLRCVSRSDKPNLFAVVSGIPPEGTAVIHTCSHVRTFGYDGLDAYELAVLLGKTIYSEDVWLHPIESLDGLLKEVEDLKFNLDKEIEDVRKDVDSAFHDIGSAFEEFAGDVEKNYSKKSETIKELDISFVQDTETVKVSLEGQYADSVQGSHVVMENRIIPSSTTTKAGVMSASDKGKLDRLYDCWDVSALFVRGGMLNIRLEELCKRVLYADGASVVCMPYSSDKVVLERSVIVYYGSGMSARRECAVISGGSSSVTTDEVRTNEYNLP